MERQCRRFFGRNGGFHEFDMPRVDDVPPLADRKVNVRANKVQIGISGRPRTLPASAHCAAVTSVIRILRQTGVVAETRCADSFSMSAGIAG